MHRALGDSLAAKGDLGAITHYQSALAADPEDADAASNLGVMLRRAGREGEAIAAYRLALAADPLHPSAGYNLGRALLHAGSPVEAYLHLRRAASLRPTEAERWNALGAACQARGDGPGAEAAHGQAFALEPKAEFANDYANALRGAGKLEAALRAYDAALAAAPSSPDIHYNRSLLLLLMGQHEAGWREHEWRWGASGFTSPRRSFGDIPEWSGAALPQGTLLVHWEQGFGDTIQFIRYIRAARARVGRLVFEAQPPLVSLLKAGGDLGIDELIAAGDPLPHFDAHVALLGLPHRLGHCAGAAPPYLRSPKPSPEQPNSLLKIGLVWAGNPKHGNDRNRSIPLASLAAALMGAAPDAEFCSLQVGPRARDLEAFGLKGRIADSTVGIVDFQDTAAALNGLDLLVGVDTAVAHLAGASGYPTWVLLPYAPDWRWGAAGTMTHWYPSMRLFRQHAPGDWAGVLENVAAALTDWSRAKGSV